MHRNIYERVEVMFHLRNPELRNQVFTEVIEPYLGGHGKNARLAARWKVRAKPSGGRRRDFAERLSL